ncbi:Hsp70 family protein [Arthrobacter sp. ISL-95]|uniref:Hsp70 family protein n=1 Tax=Arthrobacter sp. ISL-95 TaxID=2819116 RepID=UPI001BE973B9|nr:Hsp70 family protein [Arthrobacter sp. ISL-95]
MAYVLAVDVGTDQITCAAAEWGSGGLQKPRLVSLGLSSVSVPNVLFFAEDGRTLVGEEAEASGLADPDRVLRGYKHRVGDSVPIRVGEKGVFAEYLLSIATRWAVDRVKELEGSDAASLIVSYPPAWGEYRTGLLRDALTAVGLDDVTLMSESMAAASYFASKQNVETGSVIAICSLGAGFSASVLKKSSDGTFSSLSHCEHPDMLGGASFDDAVLRHVMQSANGEIARLHQSGNQNVPALSLLRRHCVEAKENLSTDPETIILVPLPESQFQVRLTREEFEDSIGDQVDETIDVLLGTMDRAGVKSEDLAAIVLTGGSARIPLIARLGLERTARPVFVDAESDAAISLGAASAAEQAVVRLPITAEASVNAPVQLAIAETDLTDGPRRESRWRPAADSKRRVIRQRSWARIAMAGAVAALSIVTLTGAQDPPTTETLAPLIAPEAIEGQPSPGSPVGPEQLPKDATATEPSPDVAASPTDAQPKLHATELVPFPGQTASTPPPANLPSPPGRPTTNGDNTTSSPAGTASNDGAGATIPGAEIPAGQAPALIPQPAVTSGVDVVPAPGTPSPAPAPAEAAEPEPLPDQSPSDPGSTPEVPQATQDLVE